jgi:ATP-dependent RNA helicase RhlB
MKFTDFTLDSALQEGLAEAGYITCMPVQEQVLKNGLEGADLYVQSQTGTGKTAAYLVTIMQRLVSDPALSGKKALIMVPTRELAVQVEEEAHILESCMKLKSASFYGGVGYGGQQDLLKKGVDIIIGTPGRVIDLQQSGTMKMDEVAFLVIDEADRMFDMGFYPDLRVLIKVLPPAEKRQTMLFSATLNAWVKNLAWEYTIDAKEITIESENVTVTEIEQILYHVSSDEKMKLLLGILKNENPESLIIFCNTKRMSEVVAKRLKINGYEADFIIGDLPQAKRLQVIDSFKSGSLKCLVATDVAARGIDVNDLAMVINYDLPNEAENYVHRTGRTARAGKTGKAYTFCSEQDVYNLPAIQKYIGASEDMMVEDKSAHVYIRTDRYENDYADDDSGRGNGRGRSGPSRGSDRRPSGPGRGRPEGERRDGPGGSSRGPRPESRGPAGGNRGQGPEGQRPYGNNRRPEDGNRGQRPDNRVPMGENRGAGQDTRRPYSENRPQKNPAGDWSEQDLSKLTFDERMAFYKNKYGSEESARAAENQRQGAGSGSAERPSRRPDQNRGADTRGAQGRRRERQPGVSPTDRTEGERGPQNGNRTPGGREGNGQARNDAPTRNRGNSQIQDRSRGAFRENAPTQGKDNAQPGRNAQTQGSGNGQKPRTNPPRNQGVQGKPSGAKQNVAATAPQKKAGVGTGFGGLIKKLFGKKTVTK